MATKIEWTSEVFNPVHGCTKVSEACQNCYAEAMARRLQGNHIESYENGFEVTLNRMELAKPYSWRKPRLVFTCSMGDLFHEDVPDDFIIDVIMTIEHTPRHTYQILTKRADRMADFFRRNSLPNNAWLGVTCESGKYYNRIQALRSIGGASVKFLSCEPLLGDMSDINLDGIDWVITGGESGTRARKTPVGWFRNLRDRCVETNTPFFFKQWGAWGEDGVKRSKYKNGSMLDGVKWKQMPNI